MNLTEWFVDNTYVPLALLSVDSGWLKATSAPYKGAPKEVLDRILDAKLSGFHWRTFSYLAVPFRTLVEQVWPRLPREDRNLAALVLPDRPVHYYADLDGRFEWALQADAAERCRQEFLYEFDAYFRQRFGRAPRLDGMHWERALHPAKLSLHVHITSEAFATHVDLKEFARGFRVHLEQRSSTETSFVCRRVRSGQAFECLVDDSVYNKHSLLRLCGNCKPHGPTLEYWPHSSVVWKDVDLLWRGLPNYALPSAAAFLVCPATVEPRQKQLSYALGRRSSPPTFVAIDDPSRLVPGEMYMHVEVDTRTDPESAMTDGEVVVWGWASVMVAMVVRRCKVCRVDCVPTVPPLTPTPSHPYYDYQGDFHEPTRELTLDQLEQVCVMRIDWYKQLEKSQAHRSGDKTRRCLFPRDEQQRNIDTWMYNTLAYAASQTHEASRVFRRGELAIDAHRFAWRGWYSVAELAKRHWGAQIRDGRIEVEFDSGTFRVMQMMRYESGAYLERGRLVGPPSVWLEDAMAWCRRRHDANLLHATRVAPLVSHPAFRALLKRLEKRLLDGQTAGVTSLVSTIARPVVPFTTLEALVASMPGCMSNLHARAMAEARNGDKPLTFAARQAYFLFMFASGLTPTTLMEALYSKQVLLRGTEYVQRQFKPHIEEAYQKWYLPWKKKKAEQKEPFVGTKCDTIMRDALCPFVVTPSTTPGQAKFACAAMCAHAAGGKELPKGLVGTPLLYSQHVRRHTKVEHTP